MSDIKHCSQEVAQVVAYEIAAFDRLSGRLKLSCKESKSFIPEEITLVGTGHSDADEWELSTEIESLLVHTRVLREFFYYYWNFKEQNYRREERRYPDDVIAQDFIGDWIACCPTIGPYLSKHKDRLDKSLAHLSTERVEYKQKEKRWEIETIQGELHRAIDRFKERLPAHMADWFVLKVVEE
jgi:hypothetical protein